MAPTQWKHLRRCLRLLAAAVVAVAVGALAVVPSSPASAERAADPDDGYLVRGGSARTLAFPGAASTYPAGINDRGFEDIDVPGARYSLAWGINDRRQVVGTALNDLVNGSDAQGFLLTGRDTFRPIEIGGTTRTVGFDINKRRQIVAKIAPAAPDQQADTAPPMDTAAGMSLAPESRASTSQLTK